MTRPPIPFQRARTAAINARHAAIAARQTLAARFLAVIPSIKTMALTLSVLVSGLVFLATLWEHWPTAIMLQPVAVPPSLVQQGFAPTVVAGRLKAALADIDRKASTNSARAPRGALPAELADFQIPGQSFSLKTGVAFLKQLLGRPDINIDVDITEDAGGFTAQVHANPSTRHPMPPVHFDAKTDRNQAMQMIAETIMRGVKPLVLASFRTTLAKESCDGGATGCDYSTALDLYSEMLRDIGSADHPWALLGRCRIFYELRQEQKVQEACGLAIELYPDFDRPYVIRAMSSMRTDLSTASADLERAVARNPHNATAYFIWGQLLFNTAKYDSAAEKFALAATIEPRNAATLRHWGGALYSAGRLDEARAIYRRALLIDPENEESRNGWKHASRTQADSATTITRR
jgi:tetratricopeptide (TPR) repeat protein